MAAITIPNTFTAGQRIQASKFNDNNTAITDQVNGSLDNSNISASAAIAESKISFSASGHGHTGSTDGNQIATGAIEDGAVTGVKTTKALNNSSRGTVIYKSDVITNLANGASELVTFTGDAFSLPPVISLFMLDVGGNYNNMDYHADGNLPATPSLNNGYCITNWTAASFRVLNATGGQASFRWAAVGI